MGCFTLELARKKAPKESRDRLHFVNCPQMLKISKLSYIEKTNETMGKGRMIIERNTKPVVYASIPENPSISDNDENNSQSETKRDYNTPQESPEVDIFANFPPDAEHSREKITSDTSVSLCKYFNISIHQKELERSKQLRTRKSLLPVPVANVPQIRESSSSNKEQGTYEFTFTPTPLISSSPEQINNSGSYIGGLQGQLDENQDFPNQPPDPFDDSWFKEDLMSNSQSKSQHLVRIDEAQAVVNLKIRNDMFNIGVAYYLTIFNIIMEVLSSSRASQQLKKHSTEFSGSLLSDQMFIPEQVEGRDDYKGESTGIKSPTEVLSRFDENDQERILEVIENAFKQYHKIPRGVEKELLNKFPLLTMSNIKELAMWQAGRHLEGLTGVQTEGLSPPKSPEDSEYLDTLPKPDMEEQRFRRSVEVFSLGGDDESETSEMECSKPKLTQKMLKILDRSNNPVDIQIMTDTSQDPDSNVNPPENNENTTEDESPTDNLLLVEVCNSEINVEGSGSRVVVGVKKLEARVQIKHGDEDINIETHSYIECIDFQAKIAPTTVDPLTRPWIFSLKSGKSPEQVLENIIEPTTVHVKLIQKHGDVEKSMEQTQDRNNVTVSVEKLEFHINDERVRLIRWLTTSVISPDLPLLKDKYQAMIKSQFHNLIDGRPMGKILEERENLNHQISEIHWLLNTKIIQEHLALYQEYTQNLAIKSEKMKKLQRNWGFVLSYIQAQEAMRRAMNMNLRVNNLTTDVTIKEVQITLENGQQKNPFMNITLRCIHTTFRLINSLGSDVGEISFRLKWMNMTNLKHCFNSAASIQDPGFNAEDVKKWKEVVKPAGKTKDKNIIKLNANCEYIRKLENPGSMHNPYQGLKQDFRLRLNVYSVEVVPLNLHITWCLIDELVDFVSGKRFKKEQKHHKKAKHQARAVAVRDMMSDNVFKDTDFYKSIEQYLQGMRETKDEEKIETYDSPFRLSEFLERVSIDLKLLPVRLQVSLWKGASKRSLAAVCPNLNNFNVVLFKRNRPYSDLSLNRLLSQFKRDVSIDLLNSITKIGPHGYASPNRNRNEDDNHKANMLFGNRE